MNRAVQGPGELSHRTRTAHLQRMGAETFDLVVIGGGITGAGVAREGALRGMSVALLERLDFASGTSSRSSKLIHGGLRYLQQGDVGLVREAAAERYVLRRLAPYLARPVPLLVPVHGRSGYAKIRVGLWTFDRLAHVPDEERHRMLGRDEAIQIEPVLSAERLYGAGFYYECLTDDARLVLAVIRAAAALGAAVANRLEVVGFLLDEGRVEGVRARDTLSGDVVEVRGRVVVNAAGPWVDQVRLQCEADGRPRLRLTKGIHVAVCRERLPLSHIVVMSARDGRSVFAIPHEQVTYIGTTDTFYDRPDVDPEITTDDVAYLLEAANRTFAVDPLEESDVVSAWAGLRPLLAEEGKQPSEISRKDEIMESPTGLLSIAGGKLTTFRRMAERIVDLAAKRLEAAGGEVAPRRGDSAASPLPGGATGEDLAAYERHLAEWAPAALRDVVHRLVGLYGSDATLVLDRMRDEPGARERLAPDSALTRAEVEHCVRHEMAMTLEDLLERRTRLLLWHPANGLDVAEAAAAVMARELGWDAERTAAEVERYRAHVERLKSFREASEGAGGEGAAKVAAVAGHG